MVIASIMDATQVITIRADFVPFMSTCNLCRHAPRRPL
jgi:hypothetical protein